MGFVTQHPCPFSWYWYPHVTLENLPFLFLSAIMLLIELTSPLIPRVGVWLRPGQSEHCFPPAAVIPSNQWHFWGCRGGRLAMDRGEARARRQISENRVLDPAMLEDRNYLCTFQLHRPRNSPFGLSQCGYFWLFLFNSVPNPPRGSLSELKTEPYGGLKSPTWSSLYPRWLRPFPFPFPLAYFFFTSYWSIIALQWCVSFCCIRKWIS